MHALPLPLSTRMVRPVGGAGDTSQRRLDMHGQENITATRTIVTAVAVEAADAAGFAAAAVPARLAGGAALPPPLSRRLLPNVFSCKKAAFAVFATDPDVQAIEACFWAGAQQGWRSL